MVGLHILEGGSEVLFTISGEENLRNYVIFDEQRLEE